MSGRLLLVDDEPGLREAVQAFLEDSGFTVQAASNANEAWQLLQKNPPDLVISDIMMPQVDGYQFLKQLREDPRFETLPVVFLTARGMKADRINGYQAGCDAYLSKPFEPDELVAIVKNLVERRKAVAKNSGTSADIEDIARQIEAIRKMLEQSGGFPQNVLDLVAQGLMIRKLLAVWKPASAMWKSTLAVYLAKLAQIVALS
jgi:DNA-binding response OmpR family regulator